MNRDDQTEPAEATKLTGGSGAWSWLQCSAWVGEAARLKDKSRPSHRIESGLELSNSRTDSLRGGGGFPQ
jgi:hypothetical protein